MEIQAEKIVKGVEEALSNSGERGFRQSVEVAINLANLDLNDPKNRINEEVLLPKVKERFKVAIFAGGEMAMKSKGVADLVIPPEELGEIASDKRRAKKIANSYDYFVSDATLMPEIGKKWGVYLGTRGKMPKPLPPEADPRGLISVLKRSVRVRTKNKPVIHAFVGTTDMKAGEIAENIEAILERIESNLENPSNNLGSVWVKTTMGKAVRLER
jgi:large subunit ribosomal protein L1